MSQLAAQRANAEALVKKIVNALDDKKATDIRVIDITGKTSVADYLVIATGLADQHLRGMRMEIEKTLDEAGVTINGVESQDGSGWTVMGTFEVMVHLFRADQRANYKIEQLWNEGVEIPVNKFIVAHTKPEGYVSVSGNSKTPAAPVKKAAAKKAVPVKAPIVKKALSAKLAATKAAVQVKMQASGRKANNIGRKSPTLKAAAAAAKATKAVPAGKAPATKKPAPAKAPVKAAARPAAKPAAKPAPKAAAAKKPVKAAAKPAVKAAAKPVAKPAAKAGVVTRPAKKKA